MEESPGGPAARCVGRTGCGGGSGRVAGPRRTGRRRRDRGDRRGLGVPAAVADRCGGGRAVMAGPRPGGLGRGHAGDPRDAAGLDGVDGTAARRRARGRRVRADRDRDRRGLRGERGPEAGGGRGAAVPRRADAVRTRRGVSRTGGLVVPEQPRHPRRRSGGRAGPAAAPPRGGHAAARRGCRAAARAGGGPLPARRARRRGARRRRGGGLAARVPAPRPEGGITAGTAEEERSRPHGPRPPRRPGCRRPAAPGWNSRGP